MEQAPASVSSEAVAALTALLRGLLPEMWRHDVAVSRYPDGFALRCHDAEGRPHVFEVRRKRPEAGAALLAGSAMDYSYTLPDAALAAPDRVEAYQAVLAAFTAHEADVLAALGAIDALDAKDTSPELAALLAALLPPSWRNRVVATLTPGGFALRFEDGSGHTHALNARPRHHNEPALVEGQTLSFGYTLVDPALDEAALAPAYRATLEAFAAKEGNITPWLTEEVGAPTGEGLATGTFEPFPNERPAPDGLVELLTAALPEAWRVNLSAALFDDGFVLRFEDREGQRHIFEARRGDASPAMVKGQALGFSYRAVEATGNEVSLVAAYRDAAKAFLAREDELLGWIDVAPAAPENEGLATGSFEVFPDERPAPAALAELLTAALPEAWRNDLSVALTPQGFVLRFADGEGRPHILEARRGDESPAMVKGHTLGFSYRAVDDTRDEVALVAAYRAAMPPLLAREDELLALLAEAPEEAPGTPATREVRAFILTLLPEAWRRDVEVLTTADGLVIRCLGDDGLTHHIVTRKLTPGAAHAVRGESYGYDYAPDPGRPAEPVEGARRALLRSLASHERNIVTLLTQTAHEARWSEPYPDAEAPSTTLADAVAALLPAEARGDVQVQKIPDGFSARFRDARGTQHMIEGRAVRTGFPSLLRGQALGFSYMKVDPALDEVSAVRWYRELLQAFLAAEGPLAATLAAT